MSEPATATAVAAAFTTITLAAFGVDHLSLLYGMIGALMALSGPATMGRARAIVYVSLSTIVGAVMGNVTADYFGIKNKFYLMAFCIIGGLIAQATAAAIFRAAPRLIDLFVRGIEAAIPAWMKGDKP